MRFMLLMFPHPDAETGKLPTAEEVGAMMKFNEELAKAGVLLALDGLHSSAKGARIRLSTTRKPQVVEGPFTGATNVLGGYWMLQLKSKEEALEWAKRVPPFDDQTTVEVRQVFEPTDFPADVQTALDNPTVKKAVETARA